MDTSISSFTEFYLNCRSKIDAALFDIDGTLSASGKALPGASALLEKMALDNFPFLLLTNDSYNSCEQKLEILSNAGLPVRSSQILSSGDVLSYWAETSGYQGELYFQYGHLGNPSFPAKAHISVTSDRNEITHCRGVLVGEGEFDWHRDTEAVFNFFLKKPDADLIVANPDSYWPSCRTDGMGIGAGGLARFICALLNDAGVKISPVYLGKPYAPIYNCACSKLQAEFPGAIPTRPERIAAVGDSLASDIRGGNINGLLSCLVLTGITSRQMAENASLERRPAMIFDSI